MKSYTELLRNCLFLMKLCCLALNTNAIYDQNENIKFFKNYQYCISEELRTNNINFSYMDNTDDEQKHKDIPRMLKKFYHTNEIYEFIDNLQIRNSDFVEVSTIGQTKQGTNLKIIKIKSDSNLNNSDIIWIDGGTHAREWITISSLLYIANELICNRHSLPKYMRNINFVLMPIVNPDGYAYSHEKDRLWRKNCAETYNKDCNGIDLNRNWDYEWNINSDKRACSENYRGPAPNSELEIKAIIQFFMRNLSNMKGFLTLHSYGQAILYPWAHKKSHSKDYNELHNIATSISSKIFEETLKTYSVGQASDMYKVSGSSIDWMKGKAKIKYVFAMELRDTGIRGFNLSKSEIIPTGQEALCAVSILAERITTNYQPKRAFCKLLHYYFCILFIIYNVF